MKLNYIKIDINIIKTKSKSSKFSDLLHNNFEDDQETILVRFGRYWPGIGVQNHRQILDKQIVVLTPVLVPTLKN